jgi:hypothetical protein
MIVVAIIGVLGSVALPTFRTFTLRARQSERRLVMRTIKQSAEDFYVRYGRIEDSAGNWLVALVGAPNPAGNASASRRPYDAAAAGWSRLGVTEQLIDGSLYYTYSWLIVDIPAAQMMWQQADGDLDEDGRLSNRWEMYQLQNQSYTLSAEWPPALAGGGNAQDMDVGGVPTW